MGAGVKHLNEVFDRISLCEGSIDCGEWVGENSFKRFFLNVSLFCT